MRRSYTADGERHPEQDEPKQPDEVVVTMAHQIMDANPKLTFKVAKAMVLRTHPDLAMAYTKQFVN